MNFATSSPRLARVAERRRGERGFALIELLLSLVILALLTGFIAGGLSIGQRAFNADRSSEIRSETSAAIQTIATLIGSALSFRSNEAGQKGTIRFDGRQELLSFVGLSAGRALRGGLHKIVLRRSGGDFVADFTELNEALSKDGPKTVSTNVVVLSGVREVHIKFFGTIESKGKSAWHAGWVRADRLPDLVSFRVDFDDERRNEPAIIVALRQG